MQIVASDLDVPVLGQLTPPQLPLGGSLETCKLPAVRFDAALGSGGTGHAPAYPHHAVVFADFNAKFTTACRSAFYRSSSGKGEEHRRIRWAMSKR